MSGDNEKHEHDISNLYDVADLFTQTDETTAIDESDLVTYLTAVQGYSQDEAQWAVKSLQRSGKLGQVPKVGTEEASFVRKK